MAYDESSVHSSDETGVFRKFLILLIAGFLLIFAGVLILVVATALSNGDLSFGAFILIGPIPIVLGAGPHGIWMVLLGIVITVLSVVIFLLFRRKVNV